MTLRTARKEKPMKWIASVAQIDPPTIPLQSGCPVQPSVRLESQLARDIEITGGTLEEAFLELTGEPDIDGAGLPAR